MKKQTNNIPNDYVLVEFIKSYSPYIKGDITCIPKKECPFLIKQGVIKKL